MLMFQKEWEMTFDNFMRLILMFDLPTLTSNDRREYRKFVKYLVNDGYCRINYSVYAKLCQLTERSRKLW